MPHGNLHGLHGLHVSCTATNFEVIGAAMPREIITLQAPLNDSSCNTLAETIPIISHSYITNHYHINVSVIF